VLDLGIGSGTVRPTAMFFVVNGARFERRGVPFAFARNDQQMG
jgi:hypothetical protein